jgi:SAM-dependent methyltransferase
MPNPQPVRFSDGASYDTMMGVWSRLVGDIFLTWINPATGLDWIDVGCGSGAFTRLALERCAPRSILGIDPSEAQLEFARSQEIGPVASFERGDAMALRLRDNSVDVATAALVVHFMPDPIMSIAEMVRVVRPGGVVAAYAWDLSGGGFPYESVHREMNRLGLRAPDPPHPNAGDEQELLHLWRVAGLERVSQRKIEVSRLFATFEDYWRIATQSPRIAAALADSPDKVVTQLAKNLRLSLPQRPDGTYLPTARANAIAGHVSG